MNFNDDYTMTINGKAVTSPSTIDVVNPATGEAFAKAPDATKEQLDEAVAAARAAFKTWKKTPIAERQALVKKAGDLVMANAKELTALFTREQGRPLNLAVQEIMGAALWFQTYAKMTPPVHVVEDTKARRIETSYVPLGVVCAISPWNFPVLLSTWKIAPALVAGNTVVLKPSPFTPLCMLKIGEILRDVFPPGVLNIITGNDQLGPLMTSHPGFDKISFTGSTATGKRVMESAARDLKRVTLELGGNDAAIVLPDVDVDKVADKIFMGAFANTAQVCVATKRLFIHEDIYDAMRDRLAELARKTKMGDGAEAGTVLGPLQNKRQYDRVMNLMEDARKSGLKLICGEAPEGSKGYFIPVTLVDNPPDDSRVVKEEAFGPILPLLKFKDIDEVVERANESEYGLAGAVWSKDPEKALEVGRQIETGTVWINQNL